MTPTPESVASNILAASPTLASAIALGLAWQRASAALPEDWPGLAQAPTPEASLIALARHWRPVVAEWRHAKEWRNHNGSIVQCDQPTGIKRVCGCTTPTPDPASPCGRLLEDDDLPGVERPCGWPVSGTVHSRQHPHQPTRCTCGHPIERTDR